jgi:hypothetical protein
MAAQPGTEPLKLLTEAAIMKVPAPAPELAMKL